ncbi:MAG: hypothetical protein JWM44_3381 [Bacilli bacterium]|nr:hypothetical protein [Bacilli bacterium]
MKKVILTTGLSLALLAGGAMAAQAAGLPVFKTATVSSTPVVITGQATPEQADPTEVKGTETNDTADKEINPADEQAQLQSQAKVTTEQSKAAALNKVSGTVQSVTLEDEDNTAVYNVAVKDSTGKIQEVKVNAQTGVVIKVDSSDGEKQDNEGSDTETADDNK